MRATQMTPALLLQKSRELNWVAHTEFTLRPRFARTGVVGHDREQKSPPENRRAF